MEKLFEKGLIDDGIVGVKLKVRGHHLQIQGIGAFVKHDLHALPAEDLDPSQRVAEGVNFMA
jgi:hypothetical protein